jgi:hypothetical protein
LFRFGFRQTAPGDLGVSVNNRRNHDVFKGARLSEQRFYSDLGFFRRSVRE